MAISHEFGYERPATIEEAVKLLAIDKRPIGRSEIDKHVIVVFTPNFGVLPAHTRVVDME